MTLRYTFTQKNSAPLRFGFFMHDGNDYVEIYSPGTRLGATCENDAIGFKSFNSFGIVSGVTGSKTNDFTEYTGAEPSGTEAKQYSKALSTGPNGRPGGYTYTDVILDGDFVITLKCHDEGGGGDGYIFIGFHEQSYTKYTHTRLNGDDGFASDAFWGAYSVPNNKIDVSFDGLNGKEGTTYVDKESSGTYYWSWVRKGDTLYTYDSANAPGTADVADVMTLRYTFTQKNSAPLRFGFFMHDGNDYVEIYSPGTKINTV